MSIMGTGVAAGVAQTTSQSQQVARQRDRRARESADASKQTDQAFLRQVEAIEEDDTQGPKVESQLHDREHPLEQVERHAGQNHPAADQPDQQPTPDAQGDPDDQPDQQQAEPTNEQLVKTIASIAPQRDDHGQAPLYAHLDVEA